MSEVSRAVERSNRLYDALKEFYDDDESYDDSDFDE